MAEETAVAIDTSTEVADAPILETEAPVIEDGTQPVLDGETQQEETTVDDTPTDQPISSQQIKTHIEELKKTNPALAKEIKNLYFAQDALKKEIPGGLAEVRQMKQAIESVGGSEGIEALKAEKQEWTTIDQKFADGDPSVLDEYAKQNPEGFAAIVPAALDKLAKLDRDSYNHALAGIFASTLDSWKFTDVMQGMAERLALIVDKDGNKLCTNEIQALGKLAEQYDGLKNLAAAAPKKQENAEQQKLASERAQLASERSKLHAEFVSGATQKHAEKQYETLITSEARNQKLNLEAMKSSGAYVRMIRQIDQEIAQEISKDQDAVGKIRNSIQTGRREEAAKLSNAKFDAVSPKVVQRIIKEWATLLNPAGVKGRPSPTNGKTGSPPTPAGVRKLNEAPETSLVDQTDPEWRTDYLMHSKAKLKTGQRVQW